jgi:hypothetical protein
LASSCKVSSEIAIDLEKFPAFENLDLDFNACVRKVQKDCDSIAFDPDEKRFERLKEEAFNQIKKTKEFKDFYCQNFKNGVVNYSPDRSCPNIKIPSKFKDCITMAPKESEDYDVIKNQCSALLSEALKPSLTLKIRDNFNSTLSRVLKNFKGLHSDKQDVVKILESVSKYTNFDYRLTTFVAGARDKASFYECMEDLGEKKPKWCDKENIIVPGGKVFLSNERLELVLAHEIGHIINKTYHPDKQYENLIGKLKKADNLGSKSIKESKEELRSETYADIHMKEYQRKFIDKSQINSHFCNYEKDLSKEKSFYKLGTNYLHPYHRQALINCD